jgi:5-(carboxyamino)imidazole ribonucleotide mutase
LPPPCDPPAGTVNLAYVSVFPSTIDDMTAPIAIIMGSQSDWETMRRRL